MYETGGQWGRLDLGEENESVSPSSKNANPKKAAPLRAGMRPIELQPEQLIADAMLDMVLFQSIEGSAGIML